MLSSAGFCGDVLLPSHWLRGVKHPSFVTVCFQHFLDVVHLCVLVFFFCYQYMTYNAQNVTNTIIGETAKTLGTRIKEHLSCRQPLSAISEHKLNTGHQCSMKDVNILDHEENWHRRKIKEAINIHRKKPTLNRDVGQELPPVLLQLVSHDIGHVTHP